MLGVETEEYSYSKGIHNGRAKHNAMKKNKRYAREINKETNTKRRRTEKEREKRI